MTRVLITGANRGVGLALVHQYASAGSEVIACCRDPQNAQELQNLARNSGDRVKIMQLDVADQASISALKQAVGVQPIDILINNAGINGTPKPQSANCIDAENWMLTMRINALGPILVAQALRDNILHSSEKKVVAISSVYGSITKDYGAGYASSRERYAYRSSKAALNNIMHALARDWAADGVLVGILDPGFVRTDMTGELGRTSSSSISAEESASGLKDRIAQLTTETSGEFQRFWGEPIPW
ncbi:SDR family oxidoreductase [Bradyrhizobium sp. Pha-3]|uniref:SDR family oxidoreductase n=1 Tax=Bradyrhizobium sp. Pha-3 TaxID=208375 RepID=UPI0035D4B2E8